MIIFQIDVYCVTFRPSKCDSPVAADVDRITTPVTADERVKTKTGQVHVLRPGCIVERAQNVGNPSLILHAQPAPVPSCEKPFQGLVSKRPDHGAM